MVNVRLSEDVATRLEALSKAGDHDDVKAWAGGLLRAGGS